MKPVLASLLGCISLIFPFLSTAQNPWVRLPDNGLREFGQLIKTGDDWLAISYDRTFFRSTDQGLSWQEDPKPLQLVQDTAYTVEPSAAAGSFVYITVNRKNTNTTDYAYLLRSPDNGHSWEKLVLSDYYYLLNSMAPFQDGLFLTGTNGTFRLRNNSTVLEPIGPACTKLAYSKGRLWRLLNEYLYYSDDEGNTWDLANNNIYATDFAVKGDTLCIAKSNFPYGLYRSIDAGKTWAEISPQTPYTLSADETGFYQKSLATILFSTDGFETIRTLYQAPSAYKLSTFLKSDGVLLLSTESGLFRSTDLGDTWTFSWQGIPSENLDVAISSLCCNFLQHTDDGLIGVFGVATSGDGGANWDSDPRLPYFNRIFRKDDNYYAEAGSLLFQAPVDSSPEWALWNNSLPGSEIFQMQNDLFCTKNNDVFRSQYDGLLWDKVSTLDSVRKVFVLDDSLFGYSFNPFRFYRSDDFGKTWISRTAFGVPGTDPGYYDPVVSYQDNFFIFSTKNFHVSTDRGYTWESPYYPFNLGNYYLDIKGVAANDLGLFVLADNLINTYVYLSPDYGKHWINISQNLPPVPFEAMAFIDTTLYVLERSGALWKRTDFSFVFDSLRGTVFFDGNSDGVQSNGEYGLPNVLVGTAANQNWVATDSTGAYNMFYGIVPDTVRPVKPSPHATITPPFHLLQANSAFQDFAVTLPPGIRDMRLSLTSADYFLRGYSNILFVRVQNLGSLLASGKVVVTLDDKLEFLGSQPAPSQKNGQQITLPISGFIPPLQDRYLSLLVRTKPNVALEDTVIVTALANWSTGTDLTPADNVAVLRDIVYSAFDPNDKSVRPGFYSVDSLSQRVPLDYTVRFQNTGNAPASTVIILDTLSTDLDLTTFEFVAASHPVSLRLLPGRVLEFRFDNIQLPDSTADPAGSHGFARFRVTPYADLLPGDTIRNTAHIYFDFNDPIVTNTTETVIAFASGTSAPVTGVFLIYPNPAQDQIFFEKDDEKPGRLSLVNIAGQTLYTLPTSGRTALLDITMLPAGFFYALWETETGTKLHGKVLVWR